MGLLLVHSLITRGVVFPKRDHVASAHPWSVLIDFVKDGFYTYIYIQHTRVNNRGCNVSGGGNLHLASVHS